MPSVPVYRFAKVPKLNVNEQGIPLKTGKKPQSAKTPKYPKAGSPAPEPEPMAEEERQTGDQPYAGTYTPDPAPQRPFNELQEDTFPLSDLHMDIGAVSHWLDPQGGMGPQGPRFFAEWAGDQSQGYGNDPISRSLQIISAAGQTHGINNSNRVRQDSAKHSTLPVGHVRVAPLIPGLDHHIVHIHHPEGTITSYRAKVNEDNTGYS